MQKHLDGLKLYQQQQIVPLLLMNLKSDKQNNPATIRVGSIVAFFKSGVTRIEKNEKRKLGRVTRIYVSSDSQIRKVDILYHNPNQLKLVDNKLTGPAYNTTRLMDQLICLDDRKDMADVRDLLEHARKTASLAGVHPPSLVNDTQTQNTGLSQLEYDPSPVEDIIERRDDDITEELTASEQWTDVHSPDTNSDDDTPDVDRSDSTWTAPRHIGNNTTNDRPMTRTRGRRDGIIHTALLFSYLDN